MEESLQVGQKVRDFKEKNLDGSFLVSTGGSIQISVKAEVSIT